MWIQENKVLSIVLRDSLHQPQYVEKLEKIIRFIIKEKVNIVLYFAKVNTRSFQLNFTIALMWW